MHLNEQAYANITNLRDHCLDYLRQSITCFSDTTPLVKHRTNYGPAYGDWGRIVSDFERTHTCRNFDALQEYMDRKLQRVSPVLPR